MFSILYSMIQSIPPRLSREQRLQNLEIAMETRRQRSLIKKQINQGEITIQQVLNTTNPYLQKMRIKTILESIIGIGDKKSSLIMETLRIAKNRTIKGLGEKQKKALIEYFN